MSEITILVPLVPDAALLPNQRRKSHWSTQSEPTAELRKAAKGAALNWRMEHSNQKPFVIRGPVVVAYTVAWPNSRYKGRRPLPDCDALPTACKGMLDGLVDAGIIGGDSPDYVAEVRATQRRDIGGDGYVRIVVREIAE